MGTVSVGGERGLEESDSTIGLGDATITARPAGWLGRVGDWLEAQALFISVVAVIAIVCLAGAAAHLLQDGYLALVDGRIVALHGIPQHNQLTVMAHGGRWIDQQWLAQLGFYGLQRLGGYALLVIVDVVLVALGFALSIFAARDLGGHERQVIRALPLGALFYILTAVTIRSQVFAYPLFVVLLWLLASDLRSGPRRRTLLVFPLLVLWANLHGSATLGAGLVMLYGASCLLGQARTRGIRGFAELRGLAFVVLAPVCLLATPYGVSIVHYYDITLFNSQFGKLISEWRPAYAVPILGVPFALLVALVGSYLVRSGRRTPLFEWLTLGLLTAGGILAVRNMVWLGLASVVLLPAAMDQLGKNREPMPKRRRLNLSLSVGLLALTLVALLATVAHPASWFQRTYDQRGITEVKQILSRDPSARVFADVQYADWLLWQDPKLAGHLALDASFELLPARHLRAYVSFVNGRTGSYGDVLAPYSVLMLDPASKKEVHALLSRPGVRVVLRTKKIIVATKPATP